MGGFAHPRLALLLALPSLGACGDEITLSVDLRTDLVPGSEFTQIETTLEMDGVERDAIPAGASAADDFATGRRIAEWDGLALGNALVRVALRDSTGMLVATRLTRVVIRGDTGLVVVITRACSGVTCPGPSDEPDATECLAGTCVPPSCQPTEPETCSEVECGVCESSVACVAAACVGAACLRTPMSSRCGAGERCDEARGCVPVTPMPDGGPLERDSGPPVEDDGGPPPSIDGGPPPPTDGGIPADLVAWYTCEEIAGRMYDSTGHGHTAECVVSCPTVVPGRIGQACDFRRSDSDGLRIENHPDLEPPSALTISLHIRARDGEGSLVAKPAGSGSANSYQVEIRDFLPADPAPDVVLFTTTPDLSTWEHIDHYMDVPDDWVHLAVVWNGTTKELWVDGVREITGGGTIDYDDRADVIIGYDAQWNGAGPWLYYDGLMDEIRIYSRALPGSEIRALAP